MTHKVGHNDGSEDWDWDIQQAVNIAIAEGQIPELEDTVPKPDYIKEGSDGLYYFFYTVKASELAGLQNDITVFYTSTSSYKMDITPGSADAEKASAISFGAIEEVDAKFRGYNPLDILTTSIKKEGDLNPYLFTKEQDGTYAVLGLFLESIFEGTPLTYEDYAYVSPTIAALNADQLAYFRAIALGTDREKNATLRRLQDKTKLELSGLVAKHGLFDVDESVLDLFYDMRLKGELSKEDLAEQYRLYIFPELPGFRLPKITQFVADNSVTAPTALAYVEKAKDQVAKKLGQDLANLFDEEDYKLFSNVLATKNGAALLDAKLQPIWDENVADKYKGKDYNTSIIGIRSKAQRLGDLDETGRDKELVYNLFQMDDPEEQRKAMTAHFLEVGDAGALNKMAAGLKSQGLGQIYLSPTITGIA